MQLSEIIKNYNGDLGRSLDASGIKVGPDRGNLERLLRFLLPIWESASRLNMTRILSRYLMVEIEVAVQHLKAGADDGTREFRMASMVGGLVGDALGAPFEFDEFKPEAGVPEVLPMQDGGAFNLPAGQWTDDGAQSLCFYAALLLAKIKEGPGARFPAALAKDLLVMWRQRNDPIMTGVDGRSVGLGGTVAPALTMQEQFSQGDYLKDVSDGRQAAADEAWAYTGTYYREPAGGYPADGNGSQMRLAPMAAMAGSMVEAMDNAYLSSMTTTGGHAAADLSRWHAFLMVRSFEINAALSPDLSRQGRFDHIKAELFGKGHSKAVDFFVRRVGQSKITPPRRPDDLIEKMKNNPRFSDCMGQAAHDLKTRHAQNAMPDGTPLFPRHPDDAGADVCPDAIWKPTAVDPVAMSVIRGQGGMPLRRGGKDQSFEWRTMPFPVNQRTATSRSGNKGQPGGYYGSYAGLATTMVMHCIFHAKTPDDAVKMCIAKGGDCDSTGAMIQMIVGAMCGLQGLSEEARAWHTAVNQPVNMKLGDGVTRPWDLFGMGVGPVDCGLIRSAELEKDEPRAGLLGSTTEAPPPPPPPVDSDLGWRWTLGKYALCTLMGAGVLALIATSWPASLPLLSAFGAYSIAAAIGGGALAGLGAGMFLTGAKELRDGQVSHPMRTTLKTVLGAVLALPLLWIVGVVQGFTAIIGAAVAAGVVGATAMVGAIAKAREVTQAQPGKGDSLIGGKTPPAPHSVPEPAPTRTAPSVSGNPTGVDGGPKSTAGHSVGSDLMSGHQG